MKTTPKTDIRRPRAHLPPARRPLMTVLQVAELLGCSTDAIYRWKDQRILPYRVIGKRSVRFDPDMIDAYARGEDVRNWKPQPAQVLQLRPDDG